MRYDCRPKERVYDAGTGADTSKVEMTGTSPLPSRFSRFVHNTLFYGLLIFYAIQLVTPSAVAIADRIEMAV